MNSEEDKPKYTRSDLEKAIDRVKLGEISAYKASKLYKIPRSTIINHVIGKSKGFSVGRPPIFNSDQERLILDFILTLSGYGYPPDKPKMKQIACQFAKRFEITLNGDEWIPGEDWLTG